MDNIQVQNLQELHDIVIKNFPNETCGLLINNIFIEIPNIAEDPTNHFEFDKDIYIKYMLKGSIQGVIHSHCRPLGTPNETHIQSPSSADMQSQKDIAVPFGIIGTEGENTTDIKWFGLKQPIPTLERIYIHNLYDCLTLVADWHTLNGNIRIKSYPRHHDWLKEDRYMLMKNYVKEGFDLEVQLKDIQDGDVILFTMNGTNCMNHIGVYVGNSLFQHHTLNQLSREDSVLRWQNYITKIIRHPNFVRNK